MLSEVSNPANGTDEHPLPLLPEAVPDSLADVCALRAQASTLSTLELDACLRISTLRDMRAFIRRGILLQERFRRIPRLSGGRGKRDEQKIGREATKRSIAHDMGLSINTLDKDYRIAVTFFGPAKTPAFGGGSLVGLSRAFFLAALPLGKHALEAIQIAACKVAQSAEKERYTVRQFRKDIRVAFPSASRQPDGISEVRVRLERQELAILKRLAVEGNTDYSGVIAQLLLYHHPIDSPSP